MRQKVPGAGRRAKRSRGAAIAFLLPSLLGVVGFVLLPFLDVLRRSFLDAMGNAFVGTSNYAAVVGNTAFRLAAGNTLRFLAVCIPLLLVLSLLLALLLYSLPRIAGFFKTIFLLPMAVPVASVVFVWQAVFHRAGIFNGVLAQLGTTGVDWMATDSAFWVLVGSYIWKNFGYTLVLWLAGLAGISPSLFEAAKVDGANAVQVFFRITLPNLLPTMFTILVLSLINAFKVFREAYLVAGEYPHTSIYQLQHLFNNWFRELSMDKLAAGAVLVALGILGLILLLRKATIPEEAA